MNRIERETLRRQLVIIPGGKLTAEGPVTRLGLRSRFPSFSKKTVLLMIIPKILLFAAILYYYLTF